MSFIVEKTSIRAVWLADRITCCANRFRIGDEVDLTRVEAFESQHERHDRQAIARVSVRKKYKHKRQRAFSSFSWDKNSRLSTGLNRN